MKKWSIVIIQKVVRGFIARRTIVRSMKIRKKLPKELLQIAEKYLIIPKDPKRLLNDQRIGEEEYDMKQRHEREKFQSPDLWGFLSEINQELLHFKREIHENELREDAYATKFVDKVIAYRQEQFEGIWEKFPKAIQNFTKDSNNTALIGSLLPMKKDELVTLHYGELHSKEEKKNPRQTIHTITQSFEKKQLQTSSLTPSKQQQLIPISSEPSLEEVFPSLTSSMESMDFQMSSSLLTSPSLKPALISQPSTHSTHSMHSFQSPSKASVAPSNTSSLKKGEKKTNKKEITVSDVALAMTKNSQESLTNLLLQPDNTTNQQQGTRQTQSKSLVPSELISGPLVRKALQVTVQQEVSQQLNQLMNHNFHSKRLANDIMSAYGPDSVYVKGEATQKLLSGGLKKKTVAPGGKVVRQGGVGGSSVSGGKLQPINVDEIKKQQQAQKKKTGQKGVDGKMKEFKGKMEATHQDWITNTTKTFRMKDPSTPRDITEEVLEGRNPSDLQGQKPPQQHPTVFAGHSLLIDIPNGLNDSIERLVHAAALRCYVPDFFKGPRTDREHNDHYSSSEESSIEEQDDDSMVSAKRMRRKRRQQEKNPNHDPNYAYQIYLQMPMGLAKVKYELDCQKWSQGIINKLRIKGLNYINDVIPVSKFIICLKNVDTPKILIDKCVDLYLELKKMGDLSKGVKLPINVVDKKVMEVGLPHSGAVMSSSSSPTPSSSTSPLTPKKDNGNRKGSFFSPSKQHREGNNDVVEGELSDKNSLTTSLPADSLKESLESLEEVGHTSSNEDKALLRKTSSKRITFDESSLVMKNSNDQLPPPTTSDSTQRERDNEEPLSVDIPSTIKRPYNLSKEDLNLLEQSSKLLQEVLENTDQAEWCNLNANIEELFIQAAFLIIPHTSKRFPHYNDLLRYHLHHSPDKDIKIKTFYVNEEKDEGDEEEDQTVEGDEGGSVGSGRRKGGKGSKQHHHDDEEIMGNYAFKLYMMELLQITNEEEKIELIKTRFRASVIFTSPYTLYLKNKKIITIKQLLTIDLKDLYLPKPLFIQLEILINVIISCKIVKATLLSVPRDLQTLEKDVYYTPMYYDQKFQRTPLDPYGRPIGLGITQVKEKLKKQDLLHDKQLKQRKSELNPLIEEDLVREISIWEKNDHITRTHHAPPTLHQGSGNMSEMITKKSNKMNSKKNGDQLNLLKKDENHQFDFMIHQMDDSQMSEMKQLLLPDMKQSMNRRIRTVETLQSQSNRNSLVSSVTMIPERSNTAEEVVYHHGDNLLPSSAKTGKTRSNHDSQRLSASIPLPSTLSNNSNKNEEKNKNKNKNGDKKRLAVFTPSPQLLQDKQIFQQANDFTLSTHPLIDSSINSSIFTNTYICHYPHCGQIFSRLYTYKVHLRTHESFPEYFDYKRQPQLSYDSFS